MKTQHFAFTLGLTLLAAAAQAQFTVDGVVEAAYGPALATDDVIPATGEGAGNANLDLSAIYVGNDSTHLYVALSVAGDINAVNWGKYIIMINSPGIAGSTTGAAWGRADSSVSNFQVASWVDFGGGSGYYRWNNGGSTWDTVPGTTVVGNTAVPGVVEARVALADLGSPASITIAAYSTGGNTVDPAIDAVPGTNGNSTFGTPTTLTNFTPYTINTASVEDWTVY